MISDSQKYSNYVQEQQNALVSQFTTMLDESCKGILEQSVFMANRNTKSLDQISSSILNTMSANTAESNKLCEHLQGSEKLISTNFESVTADERQWKEVLTIKNQKNTKMASSIELKLCSLQDQTATNLELSRELIGSAIWESNAKITAASSNLLNNGLESISSFTRVLNSTTDSSEILNKDLENSRKETQNFIENTANQVQVLEATARGHQQSISSVIGDAKENVSQTKLRQNPKTGKTPKKNLKAIPSWKRTPMHEVVIQEYYQSQLVEQIPVESKLPVNITKRKRKIGQEAEVDEI